MKHGNHAIAAAVLSSFFTITRTKWFEIDLNKKEGENRRRKRPLFTIEISNRSMGNFTSVKQGSCDFPYMERNASSGNGTSCDTNIGHDVDPFFAIIQILFSVTLAFLIVRALAYYKVHAKSKSKAKTQTRVLMLLLCAMICLSVDNIDPYGFRGIFPPPVYLFLDEVAAGSTISSALVYADSFISASNTAKTMKFGARGLPLHVHVIFIALTIIGFPGSVVLSLTFRENFRLFTALRAFITVTNICFLLISLKIEAKKMVAILGAGTDSAEKLMKSVRRLLNTGIAASAVMAITGVLDLLEPSWLLVFNPDVDVIVWCVVRFVFMGAFYVLINQTKPVAQRKKKRGVHPSPTDNAGGTGIYSTAASSVESTNVGDD